MRARRVLTLCLGVSLVAVVLGPAGSATTPRPARLYVGAAAADLTPAPGVPVYSGGFGQSPPIYGQESLANDTLSARAIYVANHHRAVAMVVVDSQGLFAAVQQASSDPKTSGLGSVGMRQDAAAQLAAQKIGPRMTASDIIVQGSHSHSAPTAMGIWGPVDVRYLQEIHDRVVQAIVSAATSAQQQPAYLQWGSVDAPYLDNINTNQTDSYEGWLQDGQVSVLRAVTPDTGATIAVFANVPAHPDIVNGAGIAKTCLGNKTPLNQCPALTGDYFGAARYNLQQELGGIAVVGGATLGREESPIQVGGIGRMQNYGKAVTELIDRALSKAAYVTDDTIDSAATFVQAPGTNAALLALDAAWALPDSVKAQMDPYPIDRAVTPPYLTGAVVGTPVTALRIGKLAYITLNGEGFPEIRQSVASAVHNADMIVGLSLGNDQLGYYTSSPTWPFINGVTPYHSDHFEYNVSPVLGDDIIEAQVHNLGGLGFATDATAVPATPLENNNYAQGLHPGLQALAYPFAGDADSSGKFTTLLEGIFGNAAVKDTTIGQVGLAPGQQGPIHWVFDDGTPSFDTPMVDGRHSKTFTHAFSSGTHTVHLAAQDTSGDGASWDFQIYAYPELTASVTSASNGAAISYTGSAGGGQGTILAWRWTFSDGATASGQTVTHQFATGVTPGATLTVTDGTGTTATAQG